MDEIYNFKKISTEKSILFEYKLIKSASIFDNIKSFRLFWKL